MELLDQSIRARLFDARREHWGDIAGAIVALEVEAFGSGAFSAGYLRAEMTQPGNVSVLLLEHPANDIVGFTVATPVGSVDPARAAEEAETAYIIDTIICERLRGRGLVAILMRRLEAELYRRGYRFVERHAAVAHGYASAIERHYAGRVVARSEPMDSEWGPQVFFRIRL